MFCEISSNYTVLARAGASRQRGLSEAELHEALSNQDASQNYTCAPSDIDVRLYLEKRGKLSTVKADQGEVRKSMTKHLRETYPDMSLPTLYASLVRRMIQHINPSDPSQRKEQQHRPLAR